MENLSLILEVLENVTNVRDCHTACDQAWVVVETYPNPRGPGDCDKCWDCHSVCDCDGAAKSL